MGRRKNRNKKSVTKWIKLNLNDDVDAVLKEQKQKDDRGAAAAPVVLKEECKIDKVADTTTTENERVENDNGDDFVVVENKKKKKTMKKRKNNKTPAANKPTLTICRRCGRFVNRIHELTRINCKHVMCIHCVREQKYCPVCRALITRHRYRLDTPHFVLNKRGVCRFCHKTTVHDGVNMAHLLECDHWVCEDCASRLSCCPICKEKIVRYQLTDLERSIRYSKEAEMEVMRSMYREASKVMAEEMLSRRKRFCWCEEDEKDEDWPMLQNVRFALARCGGGDDDLELYERFKASWNMQ